MEEIGGDWYRRRSVNVNKIQYVRISKQSKERVHDSHAVWNAEDRVWKLGDIEQ